MIAADLETLAVPVGKLSLLPGNPRRGDVDAVARSLDTFGQRKPIVAKRDGTVIAGNHTLQAAQQLGWDEIAVVWVDDDETTAKAFALADNRTAELGGYDEQALADLISEVRDVDAELLAAAGWADDAVAALLASLEPEILPAQIQGDPDDVPETAPSKTVPGDVWLLGPHRLLCGDSTVPTDVDKVMAGGKADMVWTDPPYGVSYGAKNAMLNRAGRGSGTRIESDIAGDDMSAEGLADLLRASLGNACSVSEPGASWWVAAPCLAQPLLAFAEVLCELGVWRHTLVWVKDGFVLGRSDYHGRHEQLLYGWAPGGPHTPPPDRSQDSVWEFPRPRANDLHPTMKPVELIARAVRNHTKLGGVVLDPFGGSGSTLIAAHQEGRVARLVELDPKYCDVICKRWQKATGILPIAEATGNAHDFCEDDAS